jgi:hypothetical protein
MKNPRGSFVAIARLWMLGCMVLVAGGSGLGDAALEKLSHDPANWFMWGGNFYGQRYSPLD